MKYAITLLIAFILVLGLTFGAMADYGPGYWEQQTRSSNTVQELSGPLGCKPIFLVTPSTSTNATLFMQNIAGDLYLMDNAFYTSASAWSCSQSAKKNLAFAMDLTNGAFKWNYAAAGATPSFAQVMGLSSAGALTVGASLDRLVAGTLSLGTTTANAITIGSTGVTTTNAGALTSTQTLTATAAAAFNGDTDIGNAATDTLTITAAIDSDVAFLKEVNRDLGIAASTTAATVGANLTVHAGDGTAGAANNGGNLVLRAGNSGAGGTDGIVQLGATNTSALTIGATGILTTMPGSLTVTQTLTGTLTGNADTATTATNATNVGVTDDTTTAATMYPVWVTANTGNLPANVTSTKLSYNPSTGMLSSTGFTGALTGNADTVTNGLYSNVDVSFLKEVNRTVKIAASTTADTAGANLTVQAADGVGTGAGGDLALDAGSGPGAGDDGNVIIGGANTLAIKLKVDTKLDDARAIVFGTGADVNIEYDGTDNALDEALGAASHSSNIILTATAQCTEGMAITVNSTTVADAAANAKDAMGICRVAAAGAAPATIAVQGSVPAVTDAVIDINRPLKACTGGRVGEAIDSTNASREISSTTGGDFANQPANDSVTIVSDSALDVQNATIYGTTNGTDNVVTEVIAITGVGPVVTTKVDWGEILGIELDAAANGTITFSETSGGLAITTITVGNSSKGVFTVVTTAGANRAFNALPFIVADAGTTKQMGVVGTNVDYSALGSNSKNLNGATAVPLATAMNTVTKLLVGDVEAARTVYLKVRATDDDTELIIGRSLEAATAKDQTKRILLEKGH